MKNLNSEIAAYLVDFVNKLKWIHKEILLKLTCGDDSKNWNRVLCSRILDFFLRHASMVRPLSETGKLKLAGEITQLEFSLSQWFNGLSLKLETDFEIQTSYRAFRSFKSFLFLDIGQLLEFHHNEHLPPMIVLHHLFVRSYPSISLPPWHFNMTELQYSDWLDAHPNEGINLLEKCLDIYAEEVKRKGEKEYCPEYPILRGFIKSLR